LYFDRDEIESTKEQQNFDLFEDIKELREDAYQSGAVGNKALNKIAIEEFAPKEEDLRANKGLQSKKTKKTKSLKSSHTGDQPDDRDRQDAEADEALELRKKENKMDIVQ
jgi:hypothetical protein